MFSALQITPEQAELLRRLQASAERAQASLAIALDAMTAGLIPPEATIRGLTAAGEIQYETPDPPPDEPAEA